MNAFRSLLPPCAGMALLCAGAAAADGFTKQFPIASCDFKPNGGNAFFKLTPNRQLYLSNVRCVQDKDCDELVELWITMLPETKTISFDYGGKTRTVRTRVLEAYETVHGQADESSRHH